MSVGLDAVHLKRSRMIGGPSQLEVVVRFGATWFIAVWPERRALALHLVATPKLPQRAARCESSPSNNYECDGCGKAFHGRLTVELSGARADV